jgi:hypothetical protein
VNVAVKWVTFMLCVKEVVASNFSLETTILSEMFLLFPQSFQADARIVSQVNATTTSSLFQNYFSPVLLSKDVVYSELTASEVYSSEFLVQIQRSWVRFLRYQIF